ncbi:MAG TPA: hypothetical protein VKT53_08980 [Candidatus Acidoferrum sp.]|nr:hypothetical protein [Candidatus Acidoferrum sp.]
MASTDETSEQPKRDDLAAQAEQDRVDEKLGLVLAAYLLGFVVLIFVIYVSYSLQAEYPARYFNLLLVPGGGCLGWVLGIYLSPRGPQQEKQFQAYGRAIGTFLSGYVLAKIGPLFQHIFDSKGTWNSLDGARLLVFIVSFALGLLFVFIPRTQRSDRLS